MDTGNKTLTQLSEEGKEARYVTLEVGAKISGYTKDYLERLCRLRKVNYLERNMGEHVIELESLLKETQTILLSYEGLTFVDKSDLIAPTEVVLHKDVESAEARSDTPPEFSTPVPSFAQNGSEESQSKEDIFSFTGRAVVSDAHHPEQIKEKVISAPVPPLAPEKEEKIPAPVMASTLPQKKEIRESPRALHHVVHIPVAVNEMITSADEAHGENVPKLIHSAAPPEDEWDALLLGVKDTTESNVLPKTKYASPSPYHPIVTSRDARDHHEDLPLFPLLIQKEKTVLLTHESPKALLPEGARTEASLLLSSKGADSKQAPVTAQGTSLFGATNQKVTSSQSTQHISSIPMIRVMPQLPMMSEEHHAVPAGTSPLTKSLGFNIAFMALLAISSFLLLSGSDALGTNNYAALINKQIGAVVEAFGKTRTGGETVEPEVTYALQPEPNPQIESMEYHEFSDEVVIAPGDTPGTILIQPIFNDGAGSVTEYPSTHSSAN
jgi:hypothetical protein